MSKYFNHITDPMLACPCCGQMLIDPHLLFVADCIRERYNQPLKVNSCCRCTRHNIDVGGGDSSYHIALPKRHIATQAIDLSLWQGGDVGELAEAAEYVLNGMYGFIRYKTFCHIDCRTEPYREDKR